VAASLGATVLGEGTFRLFEGRQSFEGFAVKFEGWQFPIIATADGLKYDDYKGRWGNPADVLALREGYAIAVARKAAEAQGWYSETDAAGDLVVYHPDGGTITVTRAGAVDAACFEGRSCTEATAPLEAALGKPLESVAKPELLHERARISARSGE
jgi:hypothetical protein